jgi:hypothetical protein
LGDRWDITFWGKIWRAIQRLLGALLLIGFHCLLEFLLGLVFRRYEWLENFVSIALLVVFLFIYFLLLVDILFIFLPIRQARREGGSHVNKVTKS